MITLEEYEKLNPRTELKFGEISAQYVTPNTATRWRIDTLFGFMKIPNAFHGVEPIADPVVERATAPRYQDRGRSRRTRSAVGQAAYSVLILSHHPRHRGWH